MTTPLYSDMDVLPDHVRGPHVCPSGPPSGRLVETQEFAIYRVDGGRIVEVWVSADNLRWLDQFAAVLVTGRCLSRHDDVQGRS